MNIQSIILFLITGVLFISCTKEEINNPSEYKDGDTTRITLTLKSERQQLNEMQGMAQTNRAMQFPYNVPTTANMIGNKTFSPKDESLITNVHILVFNSTGQIVSNTYINKLNFSETAKIITETYCGENMDVWVVANGDVNDTEEDESKVKLEKVKNVNDLQAILISTNGDGLSRSERLTMIGNTTITITPNMAAISIQMHYLAAKVTIKVNVTDTPNDVAITITGWDVVNIPKRTYLKEHTKEDAVSGTESTDYLYSAEEYPFETIGADTKTWAQSFYLFENRRGGRIDRTLPTNPAERYPNMAFGDTDPRGKAWFAPPGATYMLIYGTYSKSGQMNNVVYKIYLGENAYNNYDVVRGKHYTFNVTIKGLNQIDIDTTVDWGNSSFTVIPYGDLEKMDAHPDFRVLRIGATAVDASTPGYATVEVLNSDNSPCQWLSVSPLNLYRYGIKQQGNTNQPFADAVGCFVQTKYDPIVAEELSFNKATFGMTRKLTEIPFSQFTVLTFQDIVVYAEEFDDTSGSGERKAKARVTYYDGNKVIGTFDFPVAQQGAIKVSDDLYMERYEEAALTLQPEMPFNIQGISTSQMQWGHYTDKDMLYPSNDRFANGNYLTANAVYQTVSPRSGMNPPQWIVAAYNAYYRTTYPRTGAPVTEPSQTTTIGYPYYYPELTASSLTIDYFHPIYNTAAPRYCHEKNRDNNGDGVIDANETVWYLPSYSDMEAITNNQTAMQNLKGGYWTSTEANTTESWAFNFSANSREANSRGKYSKTSPLRVRCVRGAGTKMKEPSLSGTVTIGVSAGTNEGCKLTIMDEVDFNLTWTITSSAPAWLKIATDVNGGGAADVQTGKGPKTLYGYASTANNSGALRNATITLRREGSPDKTTTAKQEYLLPLTVNKTSMELLFLDEENQAFTVTDANATKVEWTVSSNQTWLSISTVPFIKGTQSRTGKGNATLYAYTNSRNTSTTSQRSATITISRLGMANKTITVIQKPTPQPYRPAPHAGWAGSNIYWDAKNQRLTFDDKGVTTNADYQGVTFYWSLLIPISTVYPITLPGSIIFSPEPILPPYTVPQLVHTPNATDQNWHHLLEAHDPKKNMGDICRYISKRGWAPGAASGKTWRMPTWYEMSTFLTYSFTSQHKVVPSVSSDGTSNIPNGRLGDKNKLSLPANGWHEHLGTSGSYGHHAGYMGTYWTGTGVYAGTAGFLHFNSEQGMKPELWAYRIGIGAAVRCVLEP